MTPTFRSIYADDLEQRLAPRRASEKLFEGKKDVHGDFMYRHRRIIVPAIQAGLSTLGLYRRGLENALRPVIRHQRFEYFNLPPALDGFRILHLTDLHIDGQDGMAEILAGLLAGVAADVCVITGDFRFDLQGPCDEVYARMRTVLSAIRAPHGVLGILGNHDEADIALGMADLGVRMLVNDALRLDNGLWLAGVDDAHHYGTTDLLPTLDGVPRHAFTVLLAHTPELYAEAAAAGVDLYLCGHTHAGQICLPLIGPVLVNADCPRAYTGGRWRHGHTQGYTSAGIGCSTLPVRYNCPPEIAVIELACGRARMPV